MFFFPQRMDMTMRVCEVIIQEKIGMGTLGCGWEPSSVRIVVGQKGHCSWTFLG